MSNEIKGSALLHLLDVLLKKLACCEFIDDLPKAVPEVHLKILKELSLKPVVVLVVFNDSTLPIKYYNKLIDSDKEYSAITLKYEDIPFTYIG